MLIDEKTIMDSDLIETIRPQEIIPAHTTLNGKQSSKYNAITHGILRESITEYESSIYEGYLTDLLDEFMPQGFLEILYVERIALCYLRLFRITKVEKEFMQSRINPRVVKTSFSMAEQFQEVVNEGYTPQLNVEDINNLNNTLMRYETTIENKLYKTLHELERLQRLRNGENIPSPLLVDIQTNNSVSQKDYSIE